MMNLDSFSSMHAAGQFINVIHHGGFAVCMFWRVVDATDVMDDVVECALDAENFECITADG